VKYADDLVLVGMEEMVLQGMINGVSEIGSCCGMKINLEKTKVMRISTQPPPVQMTDKKQLQNVEYFNCLGSMITNNVRAVCEMKPRIAKAKAAFSKKIKPLFNQQTGFKFKEETS
jgi:hypothetical protein